MMSKLKIVLLPIAAVLEFIGLFIAILFALCKMDKASYSVINFFESWPDPVWYLKGWLNND